MSAPTPETRPSDSADFRKILILLGLGWAFTNIGYGIYNIPLKFVLKDELKLDAPGIAGFMALGVASNYVKALAGIVTDNIPLFGTRRRHYLLISLFLCGLGWLALGFVPRTFNWMLYTFMAAYTMVMVISTTFGGVMVEAGIRFNAAGRLTAQRIGMFRVGVLAGDPIGGMLQKLPFYVTMMGSAALHFVLIPIVWMGLKEPGGAKADYGAVRKAGREFVGLFRNRVLWWAVLMIVLIAAAPGFGTPLFLYQTEKLGLDAKFLGWMGLVNAATGLAGAGLYARMCVRFPMKRMLIASILVHGFGTLFYLLYRDRTSAIVITALEGIAQTLAILPVYDLAARGTPKGSEALGYAVMMSFWNLTNSLSDYTGSLIFKHLQWTFKDLVWLNAGTTLLVLVVVPLLPKALVGRRDGDLAVSAEAPPAH
ncbi:MAG: MFS transporter [Armatimonadota bacterium]